MASRKRTQVSYACRLCPGGKIFDRLKKGAQASWKRSLEHHVETAHPERIDDWQSLKGEKTTVPRSWVRKEQEEQDQGLEPAGELVEEAEADGDLAGLGTATEPLVANDTGHGVEPIIYRRPHQLFVATAPTITDIEPLALEADETDQLAMTGKLGQNMQ